MGPQFAMVDNFQKSQRADTDMSCVDDIVDASVAEPPTTPTSANAEIITDVEPRTSGARSAEQSRQKLAPSPRPSHRRSRRDSSFRRFKRFQAQKELRADMCVDGVDSRVSGPYKPKAGG